MFRWASLSDVAVVAPIGIGVSSKRISAIRHWCGATATTPLRDSVPGQGPSHSGCANGGVGIRNGVVTFTSSQQPKYVSTSLPPRPDGHLATAQIPQWHRWKPHHLTPQRCFGRIRGKRHAPNVAVSIVYGRTPAVGLERSGLARSQSAGVTAEGKETTVNRRIYRRVTQPGERCESPTNRPELL